MSEDKLILKLKTQDPNAWGLFTASLPRVYFLWGTIPIAIFNQLLMYMVSTNQFAILGIMVILFMTYMTYITVWSYAVFNVTERRKTDFWMIVAMLLTAGFFTNTWVAMLLTAGFFTNTWLEFLKGLFG